MRRPRTRRWQYARPRRGSRARGHGPVSVVRQDGLHGSGVAPSVASLARVLAGQGRGSAPSPARRPPGAAGGGGSSTPLSNACWQPAPPRIVLERGRKCVIFQPSSAITPAWPWPGWSPGPPPATRPSGSCGKGACAPTACPRRPPDRDNGASLNPTRRGRQGRGVDHVRALGVEPITGRPYKPTTHGAGTSASTPALLRRHGQAAPAPPPSPGPRAQARRPRPHPHDTERPHQSLPGRTTPAQARDATEAAQAPRPPHDDPPAQPARPPKAPRPRGTQIRPHRHQAHHHRTQRHHQPRRDRLPRLQIPSGPGGPDHLGRPQDHHHRPPRRGPLSQYPWPQPGTRHVSHHDPATRATPGDRPRKNPRNVTDALTHQPSPIS